MTELGLAPTTDPTILPRLQTMGGGLLDKIPTKWKDSREREAQNALRQQLLAIRALHEAHYRDDLGLSRITVPDGTRGVRASTYVSTFAWEIGVLSQQDPYTSHIYLTPHGDFFKGDPGKADNFKPAPQAVMTHVAALLGDLKQRTQ